MATASSSSLLRCWKLHNYVSTFVPKQHHPTNHPAATAEMPGFKQCLSDRGVTPEDRDEELALLALSGAHDSSLAPDGPAFGIRSSTLSLTLLSPPFSTLYIHPAFIIPEVSNW